MSNLYDIEVKPEKVSQKPALPVVDRLPVQVRRSPSGRLTQLIAGLSAAFTTAFAQRRLFVLLPFFMIGGLIAYCNLPYDPHPFALIAVAGVLCIWLMRSLNELAMMRLALSALAFWLGFSLLAVHGALFGTQMLIYPAYGVYEAQVDQVLLQTEERQRIIISHILPQGDARELPIRNARILVRDAPRLAPGDIVQGPMRFAPVPGPVVPGGFDSQFHAYFDGIGAFGNTTSRLELVGGSQTSSPERLINTLRRNIGERIDMALELPARGIARALTVGDQSRISDEVRDMMASAGLAHVLAISGLHLSLVAGGVFFVIRALLSLSYGLGQRLALKKIAALSGICVALIYLMLSGASVSAVRATIMLILIFGAVLFGRRALTMRNVAIAALFVIISDPASVFRPSFQLSFAAVVALIGTYELFRRPTERQSGMIAGFVRFFGGMATTSLIAGVATALFAAYHFQQTAPLGVLGNLVALPLVGFVVLPSAIFGVLAMPFGVEGSFLRLMGWGIDRILEVANQVSRWSQPFEFSPLLTPAALVFGLIALAGLAFFTNRTKFAGPLIALFLVIFFAQDKSPDILIASGTQAVAIREENGLALISGRDSFVVRAWQETYMEPIAAKSDMTRCDSLGCFIESPAGFSVALAKSRDAFAEDCSRANLVISRSYAPEACREMTEVIDAADLARGGVHWLRWDAGRAAFDIRPAITGVRRPWRIQR